jgi:hypothetical protein
VTEEHPFFVRFGGWTPARSLEAGDTLLGAEGTLTVVANEHEAHPRRVTVYNLEVEQAHTYFVLAEDAIDAAAVWVHNACNRPGGYQGADVDAHGNLNPRANRVPGYTPDAADGRVWSHHFIQNAWAKRNVIGYSEDAAAAVLLKSSSGEAHALISSMQNARRRTSGWGGSLRDEFNISFREMLDAGVDPATAKSVAKRAYKYFNSIGAI